MKLSRLLKFIIKRPLKSSQGFSLVELMVVVAIIGILAAIAIPNYQRFQRKSQQTEPKTMLAGIYTAEVTFTTEHGIGTNNILQAGFSPEGLVSYRVGFSNTAVSAGLDPNDTASRPSGYRGPLARDTSLIDTLALCSSVTYKDKCDLATAISNTSVPWSSFSGGACNCTAGTCNPACALDDTSNACAARSGTPTGTCTFVSGASGLIVNNTNRFQPTFTIGARGDIGGAQTDEWTMNEAKIMLNIIDGSQ